MEGSAGGSESLAQCLGYAIDVPCAWDKRHDEVVTGVLHRDGLDHFIALLCHTPGSVPATACVVAGTRRSFVPCGPRRGTEAKPPASVS